MKHTSESATLYSEQSAWRDLQQFLPERLRLESEADMPTEEFWEWRGNNIHLDRYPKPEAPAKVILHHGVGTNGRQMNLILGKTLADRGWEVTALDNLGYGLTQVLQSDTFGYDDWIQMVTDYLAHEKTRDDRPIVLYGLSAGGMVTYDVAAHAPRGTLSGIVGMTFLDQRRKEVWQATAHDKFSATVGTKGIEMLAHSPMKGMEYPMAMASKMSALCNDEDAMKVFLADKTSAGNVATMKFLDTYHTYAPDIEPPDFDICPILHTQPAEDRWTPLELSKPVLDPIDKVPVKLVMLENAGHYPLEEPGLTRMQESIDAFVREVTGTNP
ncbi:putative hydrolase, alpha/beta hydrolase family [Nocardia nova SH22a]|uniref:Putative hydrolase, alpha/beta hydrolase family n=1 Tax=Nocardia nova SH22a TaxID=1415166 RepID=W5TKS5_9NOCA|nr:alpha/beta hydrolase [Nocardia nova]AHH19945.1 putative hydrolase, alpha/beta hydrolase family [Nocardia nova SH22a]